MSAKMPFLIKCKKLPASGTKNTGKQEVFVKN
jgi:hypothetical protein